MRDDKTTWRRQIEVALLDYKEAWEDVVAQTLTAKQMDETFCNGFGSTQGEPFTMWTRNRVYFPVCYDGAEWVGSVARHPDGMPTNHIGERVG